MSRLIFINLAIDQLWDTTPILREIFPVRIPISERIVRSNEDLALYLAQPEDQVLCGRLPCQAQREYLKQFFDLPILTAIQANPYDCDEWIAEVSNCPNFRKKYDDCIFSGESQLEQKLRLAIECSSQVSPFEISLFQKYNSKTFLFYWTKQKNIPFPQSQILNIPDLEHLNSFSQEYSKPFLLKSDFGSGGGGNLDSSLLNPKFLEYILKISNKSKYEKKWVLQRKYIRMADYTAFGYVNKRPLEQQVIDDTLNLSPIKIAKISYDHRGLSSIHELVDPSLFQHLQEIYIQLGEELFTNGYRGPFGFDSILTKEEGLYPIVDLNVRMTKTHLIDAAAEKLQMKKWRAIRVRLNNPRHLDFNQWLTQISQALALNDYGNNKDGAIMRPYLTSGLSLPQSLEQTDFSNQPNFLNRQISQNIGPLEISIFCSVENSDLDSWCKQVLMSIEGVARDTAA
jgi:hypothetical protein